MSNSKRTALDVAKTITWYDLAYNVMNDLMELTTHSKFSDYFHAELTIENDSHIFKKYKKGIVTPSKIWIERFESKFAGSYDYLNHKLWFFLENKPLDEGTIELCLRNLPITFLHLICEDLSVRKFKDLSLDDIHDIKSYYNLNSLTCLIFLYYLGIKIGSLPLTNASCLAIFDSLERLSNFLPLKRSHIFIFNELTEQIFYHEFRENVLNNPTRYFISWQEWRNKYWSEQTKQDSIKSEENFIKDKAIRTYLNKHNEVVAKLESKGFKNFMARQS
ncbi:hypothetical protein [Acinetobacter baumannii]|uniref:hypothetical protein n=1 Tax=Acinetobacter baumannii TaxID=470 RepID=UPI0037B2125C